MPRPKRKVWYSVGSYDSDLWWDTASMSWVPFDKIGEDGGSNHAHSKTFVKAKRICQDLFDTGASAYIVRFWWHRGKRLTLEFSMSH